MKIASFAVLVLLLSLTSCVVKEGVIVQKWDPVDYHVDRWYPIRDTSSCAIEMVEVSTGKKFYARDRGCQVNSEYSTGDTITVIMIKKKGTKE